MNSHVYLQNSAKIYEAMAEKARRENLDTQAAIYSELADTCRAKASEELLSTLVGVLEIEGTAND